jgi:hypothetical protein
MATGVPKTKMNGNLPSDIYLVAVRTEQGVVVKKIVKK